MHLAAISNDPMGDARRPSSPSTINRDASIRLAAIAKQAGVPRFLFAGSCSIYGEGEKLDLDEARPAQPADRLRASPRSRPSRPSPRLADANFSPVFLRNATAYGHSPMLRIDLVVNNLLGSAPGLRRDPHPCRDGSPWRPLIHCRDIARAFVALRQGARRRRCTTRRSTSAANAENYQVRDVGDQVQRLIPAAKVVYTGEVGADPRNYRVNFDLLYRLLPDFRLQYNLASGMEELHRKMVEHGFCKKDFEGDQFVRLRTLKGRFHLLGSTTRGPAMIFTRDAPRGGLPDRPGKARRRARVLRTGLLRARIRRSTAWPPASFR